MKPWDACHLRAIGLACQPSQRSLPTIDGCTLLGEIYFTWESKARRLAPSSNVLQGVMLCFFFFFLSGSWMGVVFFFNFLVEWSVLGEGRIGATQGWISEDRGSKATLPLTIPRRVFKSSAKDSTRRSVGIVLHGGPRDSSAAWA